MEQGWIKLHRKMLENPIIGKPNYLALWVVLLLKANHKDKKMIWNNNLIIIKEGQLITGRKELSKETGIPETTIERILSVLEKTSQIGQQKTTKYRLITILNWKDYQHSDNKRTTNGQQTDTNKNDNNEKNDNNQSTETSSVEINTVIKAFEKLNPTSKKLYGVPIQRKAVSALIEIYGLERVMSVIEKTLPRTNGMPFFPTIATPLQLGEKWVLLESAIKRYQSEKNNKGRGFA